MVGISQEDVPLKIHGICQLHPLGPSRFGHKKKGNTSEVSQERKEKVSGEDASRTGVSETDKAL